MQNKELNYKTITKKEQVFLRERSTSDILSLKLNLKKSNISVLTDEMIQKIEENTPKYSQSYSDFLTNVYIKQSELKFEPIKSVALKEKEITELANLEEKMGNLFNDTDKDEYWRIKTGIFSERVDLTDSDSSKPDHVGLY